jgi:hypothetical protein
VRLAPGGTPTPHRPLTAPGRGARPWAAAFGLALALAAAAPAAAQEEVFYGDPIPPEVETMYLRGMDFLARSQMEQGGWTDQSHCAAAVAGLSVLAILAHGDDPNFGAYAPTLRRGIGFLMSQQNANNGYIGQSMYNHGFATLALAEAYGQMDDARVGAALRKAVDLILAAQKVNPKGAWRYDPSMRDADTTISGAQVVALAAARNAGLGVPDEALDRAVEFYRSCQGADGAIGYTGPDGGSAPRNAIGTLVAVLCRQRDDAFFRGAWRALRTGGDENGGGHFFYYLYYAAQAQFHADPAAWREWNAVNTRRLAETQGGDGSWTATYGPAFATSTALLSLALNYRFLPIYERL